MNSDRPTVTAEITFLTESEGGRRTAPILTPQYRPHIVIQSPEVRRALDDDDGVNREAYLGICFLDAPIDFQPGHAAEVTLELMYHPRVDYGQVLPDATFTVREGGKVVGYGRVIARDDAGDDPS
jgi:translation elongation factor EF-Tu-like GTPase